MNCKIGIYYVRFFKNCTLQKQPLIHQ